MIKVTPLEQAKIGKLPRPLSDWDITHDWAPKIPRMPD